MLAETWTTNPKYLSGDLTKESFKRFYEEWVKSVPTACPPTKLLIFDVKQGWEPLCKFLGKPIPEVPFPNTNDTKRMQTIFKVMNFIGYVIALSIGIFVALLAILIGFGVTGYFS